MVHNRARLKHSKGGRAARRIRAEGAGAASHKLGAAARAALPGLFVRKL
jgi:hypothetical protein